MNSSDCGTIIARLRDIISERDADLAQLQAELNGVLDTTLPEAFAERNRVTEENVRLRATMASHGLEACGCETDDTFTERSDAQWLATWYRTTFDSIKALPRHEHDYASDGIYVDAKDLDDLLNDLDAEIKFIDAEKTKAAEFKTMIADLHTQLDAIGLLEDNWDSYHAPKPNAVSIQLARTAINQIIRILPTSVGAAGDGGVALSWYNRDKHAYIEFDNDGGAVCVMYHDDEVDAKGPDAVKVREFDPDNVSNEIDAIHQFITDDQ